MKCEIWFLCGMVREVIRRQVTTESRRGTELRGRFSVFLRVSVVSLSAPLTFGNGGYVIREVVARFLGSRPQRRAGDVSPLIGPQVRCGSRQDSIHNAVICAAGNIRVNGRQSIIRALTYPARLDACDVTGNRAPELFTRP